MPRTKGSPNKFNVAKEAAKLQRQVEELVDSATTPEMNMGLLKAGMGVSLNTLIRAAAGDETIKGLSATNMVSAADKLLTLGQKVMGDEAFQELVEKAMDEQEESQEDEDPIDDSKVFKLKSFKG